MSDQAEEWRKQQIRYSDEFRRAKRNTLFWAVVTLLLAVGAPAANSPGLELAGFKNMELSGPFLLGGSLVVLIFMVLGYVRAEADVITLNSDFALDHAFQNVVDTADDLIAHFRASIAHLSETRSQFNNLSRRFKEMAGAARWRRHAIQFHPDGYRPYGEKAGGGDRGGPVER